MATNFKPKRFSFALSLVFLIAACNNPGSGVNKTSTNQLTSISVNDTLYKLYVDSTSFMALGDTSRVVFVVNLNPSKILVLHGWLSKGDGFRTPPDIMLNNYDTTKLTIGTGMYLGNIILKKSEIIKVRNAIRLYKTNWVIFIPKLIDGYHFGYTIEVTSDDPTDETRKVTTTTQTGANMNPSPPKTY